MQCPLFDCSALVSNLLLLRNLAKVATRGCKRSLLSFDDNGVCVAAESEFEEVERS